MASRDRVRSPEARLNRVLGRYANWLHLRWPSARSEAEPLLGEDGGTALAGVFVAGDLAGRPLLKFALQTGVAAARRAARELAGRTRRTAEFDLAILGAGVAGLAAAAEARRLGLRFVVFEAVEPLSTLVNFPQRKPIFTYPSDLHPEGDLQVTAGTREDLLAELRRQLEALDVPFELARAERVRRAEGRLVVELAGGRSVTAERVIVAIGRSGNFRRLEVPGESLAKVSNRLHDPADFAARDVAVVGGGDSALESAIALAEAGARVTLIHRGDAWRRPKPENVARLEALGSRIAVRLETRVRAIDERSITLERGDGGAESLPNDAVFTCLGRETPLDFFRRSGLPIAGEWTPHRAAAMSAFLLFCLWLYNWKSGGFFSDLWYRLHWFPTNLPALLAAAGGAIAAQAADPRTLLGTLAISASGPSFWYTLAYSVVIVVFGARRIRRRRTPYVTAQTLTLVAIQLVPLFLLPELILPLLDRHGLLPRALADALFPAVTYGHGREFWRAYGLVLAWPLNVYNVFTHEPLGAWLAISFVQTFVAIPLLVYFFGKGAYCGWICSCGALAETLGDTQRRKMPHGPGWNRLNLAGQVVLGIAFALLALRIAGWILPGDDALSRAFDSVLAPKYKWIVDVGLAGVVGYGTYFWLSGRVWCRFFCPLAALMHVYARFGRFRIFADKKKCISCGQCTAVCHQGIDVMNFANRGLPMADPQCVRCSACVHVCPTGVLAFGREGGRPGLVVLDTLRASPVRDSERA